MAQCLLAGNYPSWSHRQNGIWVGPLKIEMDPLKLIFSTFKGFKRPLSLWRPVLTLWLLLYRQHLPGSLMFFRFSSITFRLSCLLSLFSSFSFNSNFSLATFLRSSLRFLNPVRKSLQMNKQYSKKFISCSMHYQNTHQHGSEDIQIFSETTSTCYTLIVFILIAAHARTRVDHPSTQIIIKVYIHTEFNMTGN